MDYAEVKEEIREILNGFHADIDYDNETGLVDNKRYDSFDLVTLVVELGEDFDVEITAEEFIPENFNSLDALTKMIIKLS